MRLVIRLRPHRAHVALRRGPARVPLRGSGSRPAHSRASRRFGRRELRFAQAHARRLGADNQRRHVEALLDLLPLFSLAAGDPRCRFPWGEELKRAIRLNLRRSSRLDERAAPPDAERGPIALSALTFCSLGLLFAYLGGRFGGWRGVTEVATVGALTLVVLVAPRFVRGLAVLVALAFTPVFEAASGAYDNGLTSRKLLLELAERALSHAKERGGNRTICTSLDPGTPPGWTLTRELSPS
jgi:hypothetical protein